MDGPRKLRVSKKALDHLRHADPKLGRVIDHVGACRIEIGKHGGHLDALVRSIVFQQLSGKAAATIHGRLKAALPEGPLDARALLRLPEETMRAAGLSRQKVLYVRDLATHVAERKVELATLDALPDEEIVERLVGVKGIGVWSVQMFLLFHLGRPDVWPVDDLGVRKGVQRIHRKREMPTKREMHALGAKYAPYRSIASWYLWRSLEVEDGGW